jgi:CubicO group peptidase (beta-lactamase class C family)
MSLLAPPTFVEMTRRKFLLLVAALPTAWENAACAADARPIDYLAEIVREGLVPGAALVASRRGSVKLEKVVGTCCYVDRRNARLTLQTLHPLYSFSKLIPGTVVAIAVTEGRLDYGDLVSKYIPQFKGGGKDTITIRHCLTHSAGLTKVQSKSVLDPAGWDRALEQLCAAEVEWEPGSRTAYHGWSGAFLAAECVRRASGGLPWAELCHQKLFAPLGAKTLSYALPPNNAPVAIVPQPSPEKPWPKTAAAAFGYAGQPGAGCFGKLGDALKVLQFHLQEGVWKSKRLISPEVFREMHTVQYAKEIAAAQAAGETPKHEPWGLGPLLRGNGPACEAHNWFGFHNQNSPGVFGHAGINTFIGVGDPKLRVALVFACTNSPKSSEQTCLVRNQVTDLVFEALD